MTVAATTATVLPVVDYEPDPVSAAVPAPRAPTAPRVVHAPKPRTGYTTERDGPSPRFRDAAAFADAALRSVLEVIDRRRPLTQLRPMLTTGLIDSVDAFTRRRTGRQAAAVLRRVRLQAVDPQERIFEVAAAYTRGQRRHALACRVQFDGPPGQSAWRVVALHIG